MTSPVKMIIDTDPGVDDAIAIALAHAMPQIDLLGLTTAFGNTFVTQSSRNARYLLSMLGADAPVAQGAALPVGVTQYEPSANVHGPEGFGDITDIPQIGSDSPLLAAEFLCEMARSHAGELVVCAVAPLTNIADALALDPSFAHNVKQLVIMGGAYETAGNITSFAEANIYHDPIAADRVFASEMDISMVPADSGALKAIVKQPGVDTNPKFSPDGSRIAFESQGGTVQPVGLSDLATVSVKGGKVRNFPITRNRDVSFWFATSPEHDAGVLRPAGRPDCRLNAVGRY